MTASSFDGAFARTLKHEGGYVDHPADPGGATNLGITIGTLSGYLGRPATKGEVKALTSERVKPIYRARYWDAMHGDELPAGVDFAVYDFGVNSGPSRAIAALQRAVGVADDGHLGPITLDAARLCDPATTVERICDDRMAFLRRLSTWRTFGKGWTTRVGEVRVQALDDVHAAARPVKRPAPPELPVVPIATRPPVPITGSGVRPAPPREVILKLPPEPAAGTVRTGGLWTDFKALFVRRAA